MLYNWHGKEEPLGASIYVARGLMIYTFEETCGVITARGHINTMDYIENCDGSHKWVATGQRQGDQISWDVRHDPSGSFSWQDKSGRPMFTLSKVFDDAIEAFVKTQLGTYVAAEKDEYGVAKAPTVKTYDGPRVKYKGPCVCTQLLNANTANPFPWETATEGGQFSKKCFTCSCGRNWWQYNSEEERWAPVPDRLAFSMLMEHDGEPQQQLGTLKSGFYLLQTLRADGLIPLD